MEAVLFFDPVKPKVDLPPFVLGFPFVRRVVVGLGFYQPKKEIIFGFVSRDYAPFLEENRSVFPCFNKKVEYR